jgi:hypothetical protein
MRTALSVILGLLLTGCATQNKILVATGTIIGVEIAENPATGLYQAKLGYNRGEVAFVPTTNGYTPDVLVELQYAGLFSRSGGIYQRLAVGPNAVLQPGAMAMFLKDNSGKIDTNVLNAVKAAFDKVPELTADVRERKYKMALVYRVATNKPTWDTAASQAGYTSFGTFLTETSTTAEQCGKVEATLKANGITL